MSGVVLGSVDGSMPDKGSVTPGAAPGLGGDGSIRCNLDRSGLFGLGFRIGALSTLTLGIYRFWGKTRLRRYFWSKTLILGDPLEYIGRPRELFLGFLLAMVFLGPLFIAYSMAQALLPPLQAALFNAVLGVVVLFLSGVATFSAYRYLLSRTLWRGIRCGLDGSAWRYGLYSFGWTLLSLLTAFAIHPIAHRATRRYMASRCRVGTQHFAMDPPLRTLMTVWLMGWALLVAVLGIMALAFGGEIILAGRELAQETNPELMTDSTKLLLAVVPAVYSFSILGFLFFSLFYRFLRLKIYANAIRLGQAGLVCNLPVRRTGFAMLGRYIGTSLVAVIPMFILVPLIIAGGVALGQWLLFLAAILCVVVISGLWTGLSLAWITGPLLRKVLGSLSLTGTEWLDRLAQGQGPVSRTGEGMADLLDIDVGGL